MTMRIGVVIVAALAFVGCEKGDKQEGKGNQVPVAVSGHFRTWKQINPSPPVQDWIAVAASADGSKLVAATNDDSIGPIGHIYVSADSGATWKATPAPRLFWESVASSADGSKLVAVARDDYIYTSVDSGATWTRRGENSGWKSVASSADGTKLIAGISSFLISSNALYRSSDSGATWEKTAAFGAVALGSSADGTSLIASTAGGIQVSRDSGATWKEAGILEFNNFPSQAWTSVAISADGLTLLVGEGRGNTTDDYQGGFLYVSQDGGKQWTRRGPQKDWRSVALSADGSSLIAAAYGDYVYTSGPTGESWTQTASKQYWLAVAMAGDGKSTVAAGEGVNGGAWTGGPMFHSSDAGASWRELASPNWIAGWPSVTISGDGTKLATIGGRYSGYIFVSQDAGETWDRTSDWQRWTALASSRDGTKVLAADGDCKLYRSEDSGRTWQPRPSKCVPDRSPTSPAPALGLLASSADATRLVAAGGNYLIWTSNDSGETWKNTEEMQQWSALGSSADGKHLIAAARSDYLYRSDDFGATWKQTGTKQLWTAVASSADGDRVLAGAEDGFLYLSSDSGATWTKTATSQHWGAVAVSEDGSLLVAAVYGGSIHVSGDSGKNWEETGPSQDWVALSLSADGKTAVGAADDGYVYLSELE